MKMFLISSSPLRNAVLMSPEKPLMHLTTWDCHVAPLSDLDPGSPTYTDVLLPFQSTSMSGPIAHA